MRTTQGGQSQDLQVQLQTGRRAEHPLSEDARRGRVRKEQVALHRFTHIRLRVPCHAKRSLQSVVYRPNGWKPCCGHRRLLHGGMGYEMQCSLPYLHEDIDQ